MQFSPVLLREKNRIPALAFTVPVLLNGMLIVSLIPPVIWNVPALLNAPVAPLPNWIPFPLPFTIFQVAPARLFTIAPFIRVRLLPPAAFPNVVVPDTFSVRVSRACWPEGRLIPPLAFVAPAPLIVPPVQVSKPMRVTLPVPDRPPPPPLRFVAPSTVLAPFSVRVPPLRFKPFAHLAPRPTVTR